MLVLSRKESQTVVIDGRVLIRVNQIRGNRVAIGIEAPQDIRILRGEAHENDLRENNSPAPAASLQSVT